MGKSGSPAGRPERKTIDLDAARKARREVKAPAPALRFLERDWILPAELPAETVHAFGALISGDYVGLEVGMKALFGGQWDDLHEAGRLAEDPLSFDDEVFLLEEAMDAYGMPLPESSASAPS